MNIKIKKDSFNDKLYVYNLNDVLIYVIPMSEIEEITYKDREDRNEKMYID